MAKLRGVYLREALACSAVKRRSRVRRAARTIGWNGRAKWKRPKNSTGGSSGCRKAFMAEGRTLRILTPWKAEGERPKGWDPDINDGVKVNIEPLQRAGVLRIPEVV